MRVSMHSEEEVFGQVKRVLAELFELPPERIVPDANLYTDLDIDSLDAIDLILELKQITGRKVQPEQFRHVRTVGDVVAAVRELMRNETAA
jgi:acyl carrier protein